MVQSYQMLGTEMRTSSAISLEPGLDRGMPWGRDLITFMTSAAGYMMRTLQKPRKNKPSKRQVNHRRFLHNMIQRKFAEIEASNHQLASALFSVDTDSQRQSEVKWTHKHETEKNLKRAAAVFAETKHRGEENDTRSVDRLVIDPNETSLLSKSLSNLIGKAKQIKQDGQQGECGSESSPREITCDSEQFQWASVDLHDMPQITNIILEDSVLTSLESIDRIPETSHVHINNSPDGQQHEKHLLFDLSPASPVSPLSLTSCDFEVQMQAENAHTSQIQQTAESVEMNLMENLELLDSEDYLQKIDQMDMAAVWDIHSEEDLSCFQDCISFLNNSHTDFAMNKEATRVDGANCSGLQHITTLLEHSVKNTNVGDNLQSNVTYSLGHCGSSGHNNQAKQTRTTMDCYMNQPEISTALNKEGQCRGTWTVSEQGNISSHVLQELKNDPLDQTSPKNWEQQFIHYNHAPSEVKDPYYTMIDEDKIIIESESTLNPIVDLSNPVNSISFSAMHCYGFDLTIQANSTCIADSCSFLKDGGNLSIPSFEGVAQSFPAPYQNVHPHPVSTPPLNDDWLFSNIATEVNF